MGLDLDTDLRNGLQYVLPVRVRSFRSIHHEIAVELSERKVSSRQTRMCLPAT
jgi:hypothetical protein